MKKYLVIDESKEAGDSYTMVFDSEKEASDQARTDWEYLTRSEQNKRHIYVAEVTEDDLYDDAFDGDEIDWGFFHSCNQVGFDSEDL